MAREIAVFTDRQGKSASMLTPGKVIVYQRQSDHWKPLRELDFLLDQSRGLREMRLQLAELIGFLDSCKIFIARSVVGVAYFELEKAQITIWEYEGHPIEIFDSILAEEQDKPELSPVLIFTPKVEEPAPGSFCISIKEIQENEMGITSKQVLMPLISKKQFKTIEVICNHIPPWLEAEVAVRGYAAEIEKLGTHIYRVTIKQSA